MKSQRKVAEQIPAAEHRSECTAKNRESRLRNDDPSLPMNQRNSAQNLRLGDRRIVLGQGIAASNPLAIALLNQTMNEKPAIPRHQNDVAREQSRWQACARC